jgi:pimeloyl-ACP methyl ester carboxylesterase
VLAANHPERVGALVLIDSAGYNLESSERPRLVRAATEGPGGRLLARLPVRGLLLHVGLRQVFHDDALVTRERFDEYLAPLVRPGALESIRSLARSRGVDARMVVDAVSRVRSPTLVLWGHEDRWAPLAHGERFAREIAGARLIVFDRCGHMPQEERPAQMLDVLDEFLRLSDRSGVSMMEELSIVRHGSIR